MILAAVQSGPRRRATTLLLVACAVLLSACGDKKDKPATQAAAKVNREEITVHQINAVLQQQRGLLPDQADQASRRVLERLIDQELALQKAAEMKVDRDPRVMQAIESARREIVARAYAERIGEGASKPTPAEVKKYYDDNPALFKERRVYQLQEISIVASASQVDGLRSKLQAAKNINDFVEHLKANAIGYSANQAVRGAEQLPLGALPTLAKLKDGGTIFNATPTGAQVVVLVGSRTEPVDEAQAARAIEQFLLNERKRKIVGDDLKSLREGAKITYLGKFADAASVAPDVDKASTVTEAASAVPDAKSIGAGLGLGPAAAAASAAAYADAAVKPASGVDAAIIRKGMGLK